MTVVITMAGLGSRFKKAGYTLPKYQIEVCGKTLFEWSMLSLQGFSAKDYVFVVRAEDQAEPFIKEKCAALGIRATVINLDHMTSGQAETAMLAAAHWDADKPLLIYNIDTYIEAGEMHTAQLKGDGFIPCFKGEGDHWSFVRLNEDSSAAEVREKKRISEHCTVGAYYFASAALYEQLYNEYYISEEHKEAGERYVAPLYNHLIAKGGKVYISEIPPEKVHVLGTPEEVDIFRRENEK